MDPRNLFGLPSQSLDKRDLAYLYSITEDEDLTPDKYNRSKDMAVDILMTNLVRVYKYEDARMIADIVAPPKQVRSRTGTWKTRGKEALDIFVSDHGSDRGQTHEIGFATGESTYTCTMRRLKIFVSDEEISERGAIDPIQEAVILLRHAIDLRQEIRIRNLADATSNGVTIGNDWDISATVHADVAAAKNAFEVQLGQSATHIVIPSHIANEVLANAAIDMGVFTATSIPRGTAATAMIDVGVFPTNPWGLKPIIPNVMYNAAVNPLTSTPTRVWADDDVYLLRIDSGTRTFGWAVQQELMKPTIVRWRDEDAGGWYYKIIAKRDENEVTPEAIYQLSDVT